MAIKKSETKITTAPKAASSDFTNWLNQTVKTVGASRKFVQVGGEIGNQEFISTSHPELDAILGGGFAKGTVVELCGLSQSGKSYLAQQVCAMAQKAGGRVAWFDAENSFYEKRAEQLGVDTKTDKFILTRNYGNAEEMCDLMLKFAESETFPFSVIVLDSISIITPSTEIIKTMDKVNKIGNHAVFIQTFMRKMVPAAMRGGCVVIVINQFRTTIDKMGNVSEKATGGLALEHYTRQRLWLKQVKGGAGEIIGSTGEPIGRQSYCNVYKGNYGGQDGKWILPIYLVKADCDKILEFVYKLAKHREFQDTFKLSKKDGSCKYIDEHTGEVNELSDAPSFIQWAKSQPPPHVRPKTDKSESLHEYFLNRMKWNDAERNDLEKALENPHEPIVPSAYEEEPILEEDYTEDIE